jgi:hypothetical protein
MTFWQSLITTPPEVLRVCATGAGIGLLLLLFAEAVEHYWFERFLRLAEHVYHLFRF